MKHVVCPVCSRICIRYGKNRSGSQRWFCKNCSLVVTSVIDHSSRDLKVFLDWLFGKNIQKKMPGEGRTFRRKTSAFWDIWPMPPKIEEPRDVVYVDGIYIARKACVLICCDDTNVLGWYLCRDEHSGAWKALMQRIAEPMVVVSDGGTGFNKALKKEWPNAMHQRCVFHAFCQVKRYTTNRPKTLAGIELYELAKDLLKLQSKEESDKWRDRFIQWIIKYKEFLSQMTRDENGDLRPTHERLLKAEHSLLRLLRENTLFTYLNEDVDVENIPSTNNRIEGGVNSRLRAMLRDHRGLSVERRIKAVFWWCYMHSPEPLSASEILKVMPTDKSIADIYRKMSIRNQTEGAIPGWGDAVAWNELHMSRSFPTYWD